MKDQHKQIKGYRDLSQYEINLMNEVKQLAEEVGALVERVDTMGNFGDNGEVDHRWASIARTHLQEGFMALTRSIARPTTF